MVVALAVAGVGVVFVDAAGRSHDVAIRDRVCLNPMIEVDGERWETLDLIPESWASTKGPIYGTLEVIDRDSAVLVGPGGAELDYFRSVGFSAGNCWIS